MKKFFFFLSLFLLANTVIFAQPFDSSKITKQKPLPQKPLKPLGIVPVITVYPEAGFKGTGVNFSKVDGNLKAPFPLELVSFTVPKGKIVYLKKCDTEFPYEEAYTASQNKADLSKVCGIRSDDLAEIKVQFNGISAAIHNNDCRKMFGNIKIKVYETAPVNGAMSNMTCRTGSYYTGPDRFTFLAFNNASAATTPPYTRYAHNSNPNVPNINSVVSARGGTGPAEGVFQVGASALRDGRVGLQVITDVGSAHKTCDLCDDYTSNVRMSAPVTEGVPLNKTYGGGKIVDASQNKVILGPYRAHGSRDGFAITASAGTDKDFRVHLTVAGL